MSKLINVIQSQSALAFKIISSYFNNPSIAGITIYEETCTRGYDMDISEQVLIDNTGGRQIIHDNFALKPKTWKLTGYLKAYDYEMSFYFQPSLKTQIKQLEAARDLRDSVQFKDKYGDTFQVGMKFKIDENAEHQNVIPIDFDLVEITKLNATSALLDKVTNSGTPAQGSSKGVSANVGNS